MAAEGTQGQTGSGHSLSFLLGRAWRVTGRTLTTQAWLSVCAAVNHSRMRVSRGSRGMFGINQAPGLLCVGVVASAASS